MNIGKCYVRNSWYFLILLSLFAFLSGCGERERTNILKPDGSPSFSIMDFSETFSLDPLPDGWYHRTFFFHSPMDISFVNKEDYSALRLSTDDSASMLFRDVDIELDQYPVLSWDWFIEQGVDSEISELVEEGDDHPARLYLKFETQAGEAHRMEIIWGNRELEPGDWKHLQFSEDTSFSHYVANGGEKNTGRWFHETENLRQLYVPLWGDPAGVRLVEIALFCDTDGTGAKSIAYFANVNVEQY